MDRILKMAKYWKCTGVEMEKLKKLFHNKRKISLISNNTQSDAVPEEQRNNSRYIAKRNEVYSNFHVEDCCRTKSNETNFTFKGVQPERSHESLHVNEFGENQMQYERGVERLESPIEIMNPVERDLVQQSSAIRPTRKMPVVRVNPEHVRGLNSDTLDAVANLCNNSSESLNRFTNSLELKELNEIAQKLSQDLGPKNSFDDKKTSGNTYVITISNSTHFHIGSQKTINYPDVEPKTNNKMESQLTEISYKKSILNDSNLLDIDDKLSDDDLLQISLSIQDKWRGFARFLGANDENIHDLEVLNDRDYNLIIYDILKDYINQYPNTTVGYMISLLKKNNEVEAIKRLMEKR